jgi:hypothetical protein
MSDKKDTTRAVIQEKSTPLDYASCETVKENSSNRLSVAAAIITGFNGLLVIFVAVSIWLSSRDPWAGLDFLSYYVGALILLFMSALAGLVISYAASFRARQSRALADVCLACNLLVIVVYALVYLWIGYLG